MSALISDAVYLENYEPIRRSVARRLGSRDAGIIEDAVQETFCRAVREELTFDGRRPLLPWLRAIAMNVCEDVRSPNHTVVEQDELTNRPDVHADTERIACGRMEADNIRRVLSCLTPRH